MTVLPGSQCCHLVLYTNPSSTTRGETAEPRELPHAKTVLPGLQCELRRAKQVYGVVIPKEGLAETLPAKLSFDIPIKSPRPLCAAFHHKRFLITDKHTEISDCIPCVMVLLLHSAS